MKQTNVLVLHYNNYFNRIIKKLSTVADYRAADTEIVDHEIVHHYTVIPNVNFNPSDGVKTELILGKGQPIDLSEEYFSTCDYLIEYTVETIEGELSPVETIVRRWFIIEADRTRGGQYAIKLKRDTIADNLNSLLTCPAFIERGYLEDDNPLILNDEGMSFNEIKKEETLLKDSSKSAWIVGYVAKDTFNLDGEGNKFSVQIPDENFTDYLTIEDIAQDLGMPKSDLENILSGAAARYVNNVTFKLWINYPDHSSWENYVSSVRNGDLEFESYQQGGDYHTPTTDCIAVRSNLSGGTEHILWGHGYKGANAVGNVWSTVVNNNIANLKSGWRALTGFNFISNSMFSKLNEIAGNQTPIYVNGVFKRLVLTATTSDKVTYSVTATNAPFSTIVTEFYNYYNTLETTANRQLYDLNLSGKLFGVNCQGVNFTAALETISDTTVVPGATLEISSTRNACRDQVYDMFAIPFNDMVAGTQVGLSGDYAQAFAKTIALKADAKIYDVQLLPYCPCPEMLTTNGHIDVNNLREGYDYDYIYSSGPFKRIHSIADTDWTINAHDGIITATASWQAYTALEILIMDPQDQGYFAENSSLIDNVNVSYASRTVTISVDAANEENLYAAEISLYSTYDFREGVTGQGYVSICLYPKKASFSVNINKTLSLKDSMKIESQCNKYRLVSPNYQGSFEFNVAKNSGTCAGFIAECTYKPYTPYIKVVPQFSWMYGGNFGDCRGLICGGDFSLGRINSAWESYQLQNKNYQNIFNRDIQSLDVQQHIQRTQQYAGGIIQSFKDAGQGAAAGAMAGGGWGALAGAVTAQSVSLAGYAVDSSLLEEQLHEQKQYAIDKFNYQLGNIKALPYTLTKVGAFDINSKIWPFLEYYTCSDEEKEMLRQKILYQGMTVMAIDTLDRYLTGEGNFTKAELIRNENIHVDTHELEDIYNELYKGVYL